MIQRATRGLPPRVVAAVEKAPNAGSEADRRRSEPRARLDLRLQWPWPLVERGRAHLNAALPKRYFDEHGLVSLLSLHRRWKMAS